MPWPATETPRRAAVSAFGIGGTNAHVVLEEAPAPPAPAPAAPHQLLVLSARTPKALGEAAERLADRLRTEPPGSLADVAWTLQTGRREHEHRAHAVAGTIDDAVRVLTGIAAEPRSGKAPVHGDTVFLFTGAPGKSPSRGLYEADPAYREAADACFAAAGLPGAECFDPPHADGTAARVAAFVHDYAMAMTWIRWGVRPASVLAAGEGVAVAAAVTKVLTVAGALRLIATDRPAGGAAPARDARTVEGYATLFADADPQPPRVPLISPVLGRALTGQEASDPLAWARAARAADRDALEGALSELPAETGRVFLDISAGRVRPAAADRTDGARPDTAPPGDDLAAVLDTLGTLWAAGRPVRWRQVHGGSPRALLSLPTYPFQRDRFVVEPVDRAGGRAEESPQAPAADEPPGVAPGEVLPTLLRLYAEILGLAEVGPTDDFFDLGGDSLIAARLTARIREVYPVDVDVLSVFEAPEPAELAAVIDDLLAP